MIRIFHEAPISIMDEVQKLTGGDYCLPHLMDQNEEYKKFFIEAKNKGRYIIMDNSLHELGTAYNTERLMYWINEIKPQEFIVPDVWENCAQSIRNAKEWSKIELPEEVTKVAVVQANSFGEAFLCYHNYKDLGYKKIAFSYGAKYYANFIPHPNKDIAKALGRIHVISKLYEEKIILDNDRIHLLGCCIPQEFGFYKEFPFIESIDTSNPVMAAYEGKSYNAFGLRDKPKLNMNEIFNLPKNEGNFDLVKHNIRMFKTINSL